MRRLLVAIAFLAVQVSVWANPSLLQFSADLELHERRQASRPDRLIRLVEPEVGEGLGRLLMPDRVAQVTDAMIAARQRGERVPNVFAQFVPLITRYNLAFLASSSEYEDEYLGAMNLLLQSRRYEQDTLPPLLPVSEAPTSEEQAARERLLSHIARRNLQLAQNQRVLRAQVSRGMFSPSGATLALAMATAFKPLVPIDAPMRRTRALMNGQHAYNRLCVACHSTDLVSGAPRIGDRAAWEPLLKAGLPALIGSVARGKSGMHPNHGADFDEIEIARATVYLANASGANFAEPDIPAGHPRYVVVTPRPERSAGLPAPYIAYRTMDFEQKIALGQSVYATNCAICHRPNGAGGGVVRSLVNAPRLKVAGDAIDAILHGTGRKPTFNFLPDDQVAAVVMFMRLKFADESSPDITTEDVRGQRR